jgi:Lon protease-like protein
LSGIVELPLFPLQTVLFPGGALPLRIFEQRYMDMAAASMKDRSSFGICLTVAGTDVGQAAELHEIGTLASIADWDMTQLGILQLVVHGGERFRILSRRVDPSGLVRAEVVPLAAEVGRQMPPRCARLVPLLRAVMDDLGARAPPQPHRYYDSDWVGYRWCEVLPIPLLARQRLLELEDSISRLEIIVRFLEQKGLMK